MVPANFPIRDTPAIGFPVYEQVLSLGGKYEPCAVVRSARTFCHQDRHGWSAVETAASWCRVPLIEAANRCLGHLQQPADCVFLHGEILGLPHCVNRVPHGRKYNTPLFIFMRPAAD